MHYVPVFVVAGQYNTYFCFSSFIDFEKTPNSTQDEVVSQIICIQTLMIFALHNRKEKCFNIEMENIICYFKRAFQ